MNLLLLRKQTVTVVLPEVVDADMFLDGWTGVVEFTAVWPGALVRRPCGHLAGIQCNID